MELIEIFAALPPILQILLVVIVLGLTLFFIYSYMKMKGLDGIRADVYQLILMAEHRYEQSCTGQQKLKWVVQQARGLLPPWLQLVISEDTLMNIVNEWFLGVKDLLDDGKVNNSQKKKE